MSLVIGSVYADAVNSKLGTALKMKDIATDYTDMVSDILVYGNEVHFPTFNRLSDAEEVTKGTALVPEEVGMSDSTAKVKQTGKSVRIFDRDKAQIKGAVVDAMANQTAEVMAKKIDSDLISEMVDNAVYKTALPGELTVTANPNVIHKTKFNEKYNFSTLTLIAALYGGVDQMSEEQKTMLLAVDGGFIGYYKYGGKYSRINLYWLEKLGLTEYLLPILENHDMKYFQDFSVENGLYDKITITPDGYLETPIYRVPDYQFELVQPIKKVFASSYEVTQRIKKNENIIVSAETYENEYVLNIAV